MKKNLILSLPLFYLCTSFISTNNALPVNTGMSDSVVSTPLLLKQRPVIVWQPSHQTNTGVNFSEAAVCNGIVEAAMNAEPRMKEYKVWSLGKKDLHHADVGSNTIVEQTSAECYQSEPWLRHQDLISYFPTKHCTGQPHHHQHQGLLYLLHPLVLLSR